MVTAIQERKIVPALTLHTVVYTVDGAVRANMLTDRAADGIMPASTAYTDTVNLSDEDLVTWIEANLL